MLRVVVRVTGDTRVNGEFVDVDAVVMEVLSGGCVDSSVVLRTEAFTVLTFGNVNGAGEGLYNVDLDVSVCVFRTRLFRTARFVNVMFVVDTGTVVTFFLTCITDLFLAVAMLVLSFGR